MQKGQVQIIFGILIVLVIVGGYFGLRFFGKSEKGLLGGGEKTVQNPTDVISPLRTNFLPSGTLSAGTTKTTITLTTNEPGYCRYAKEPGQSYNDMSNRFSYSKDKMFHSVKVSGLKDGQTYKYYVRCRDLPGNKNLDDAVIEFSVGAVSAAGGPTPSSTVSGEAPPLRTNLLPSGTLSAGTTKTTISLITSEPGYCRYAKEPGQSYNDMSNRFSYSKDKLQHTATVKGLTDNKIYEYYVRCRDLAGNKNDNDAVIRFGVGGAVSPLVPAALDTVSPSRFDASPTEDLPTGTLRTTISLKTDERAVCRHSTTAGVSYDSMNNVFSSTDAISHSTEVTGLSEGGSYEYYIKCIDQQGNKNTSDFVISFEVELPEDLTPPVLRYPSHTGEVLPGGTTATVISISTNEPASCRYATEQGTAYKSMKNKFSYYDQTKLFHVATVKSLEDGKMYNFFVRCQDLAGNANTGDVMISFSIGIAP